MVARKVTVRLRPDALTEFKRVMDRDILPWLRQQAGFLDLVTMFIADSKEVTTISFWDDQADAQAYNAEGYPAALKILNKLLDGTPYVKTFDVISSTVQFTGKSKVQVKGR